MAKRARMRGPAAVGASRSRRVCAAWSRRPRGLRRGRGDRRGGSSALACGVSREPVCSKAGWLSLAVVCSTGAPHEVQNLASSARSLPHEAQYRVIATPFATFQCNTTIIPSTPKSRQLGTFLFGRQFRNVPNCCLSSHWLGGVWDAPSTGVSWLGCYNLHFRAL